MSFQIAAIAARYKSGRLLCAGFILVSILMLLAACSRSPVHIEEHYSFNDSVDEYRSALLALQLEKTEMGQRWLDWSVPGERFVSLDLLPFSELRLFDAAVPEAAYYFFEAVRGQRISIELQTTDSFGYFADLFGADTAYVPGDPQNPPDYTPAASAWFAESSAEVRQGNSRIVFEPRQTRFFLLRLIPRLLEGGSISVTLTSAPIAALWPVDNTGPAQVRSFFGDARDGGSRVHHGFDIFAPRGTPVRAPVSGRISRVGERPLGGQTVTLTGDNNGIMYYFAHLDQYGDVAVGQQVEAGHILGTVGNTGNARTTPPHLHLGIYDQSWRNPVDPWYYFVSIPVSGRYAQLPTELISAAQAGGLQADELLAGLTGPTLFRQSAANSPLPQSPARRDGSGTLLTTADRPISRLAWAEALAVAELETGRELRVVAVRQGALGLRLPDGSLAWLPASADRLALLSTDTAANLSVP